MTDQSLEAKSYPCMQVPGNTWWEVATDHAAVGVSVSPDDVVDLGVPGVDPIHVTMPLHGEVTDVEDTTTITIVDANGTPLGAVTEKSV